MQLSDQDGLILTGTEGEAARLAMELLVAVAEAERAPRLVDIESAHIDSCLYHGQAGLDFAKRLVEGQGRVQVPATLNVSSLDLLHPELYRGDPETAGRARELMDAYVELGCRPTWTCAPYQLPDRPLLGQQVAWGESNAIVFANSVLGARTNRYGDFMDICCALTGRAPYTGLHTDTGRYARFRVDLEVPDHVLNGDVLYPLLGHALGRMAGSRVPVIVGLDTRADEDRLKALGAAAASSGSVAMFHAVGVTPEAATLDQALGGRKPDLTMIIDLETLTKAREELSTGVGALGAVSVGTPHMSLTELRTLAGLVGGREALIPFFVNTSRDVLADATKEGVVALIEAFGAILVTDTCTYIAPIMGPIHGDVMTNSAKWAFYAPANLGVSVTLGSMTDCVESAVAGHQVLAAEWS